MKLLEDLNWRYATKQFDPGKKVSDSDLFRMQEAVRLSVSSYGLQLYRVLVIHDPELRTSLRAASYDQAQITDASHLFVFCNYTEKDDTHVDEYIGRICDIQGVSQTVLAGYAESIKASLGQKSDGDWQAWSQKQTYLALANLLTAAAALRIDACPMEGFDTAKYNEILGLEEQNLNAAVIAPVGYRSKDDRAQFREKVRKPARDLFQVL